MVGSEIGSFVEEDASTFFLIPSDTPNGVGAWDAALPLKRGLIYWHAYFNTPGPDDVWTPTR